MDPEGKFRLAPSGWLWSPGEIIPAAADTQNRDSLEPRLFTVNYHQDRNHPLGRGSLSSPPHAHMMDGAEESAPPPWASEFSSVKKYVFLLLMSLRSLLGFKVVSVTDLIFERKYAKSMHGSNAVTLMVTTPAPGTGLQATISAHLPGLWVWRQECEPLGGKVSPAESPKTHPSKNSITPTASSFL